MTKQYTAHAVRVTLCILLPVIILCVAFCGVRSRFRTVPDVRGMTVEDAFTRIRRTGVDKATI